MAQSLFVRLMRALEHAHSQRGATFIKTTEVRLTIYGEGRQGVPGIDIIRALVECAERQYPALRSNDPCIVCKSDPCTCDLPF